ncbi:MAG: hypothetical protein HC941_22455 [Microcoleus sp. SU_5_3]|nr:hypothetical protein [Microcoleus sp. SU_5_3]
MLKERDPFRFQKERSPVAREKVVNGDRPLDAIKSDRPLDVIKSDRPFYYQAWRYPQKRVQSSAPNLNAAIINLCHNSCGVAILSILDRL